MRPIKVNEDSLKAVNGGEGYRYAICFIDKKGTGQVIASNIFKEKEIAFKELWRYQKEIALQGSTRVVNSRVEFVC